MRHVLFEGIKGESGSPSLQKLDVDEMERLGTGLDAGFGTKIFMRGKKKSEIDKKETIANTNGLKKKMDMIKPRTQTYGVSKMLPKLDNHVSALNR